MAVKVAEEWLNICGGCEVTILDIGEPLLDLLGQLNFVHMPVLMDHKYFGQTGEKDQLRFRRRTWESSPEVCEPRKRRKLPS